MHKGYLKVILNYCDNHPDCSTCCLLPKDLNSKCRVGKIKELIVDAYMDVHYAET